MLARFAHHLGRFCCLLLIMGLLSGTALADPLSTTPDFFDVGLGYANFDKTEPLRKSADFRFEYRWGMSLLPMIDQSFNGTDRYFQVHPFAGVETSTLGVLYGLGGLAMDVPFGRHIIFTWSEGLGLYYEGHSAELGSITEFRSMGELGWRFNNDMRLSAYASHISNAKITTLNPGSEIIGLYFGIPFSSVKK